MSTARPHLYYRKGIWTFNLSSFDRTPNMLTEAAARWCGNKNLQR